MGPGSRTCRDNRKFLITGISESEACKIQCNNVCVDAGEKIGCAADMYSEVESECGPSVSSSCPKEKPICTRLASEGDSSIDICTVEGNQGRVLYSESYKCPYDEVLPEGTWCVCMIGGNPELGKARQSSKCTSDGWNWDT
ncbi:MAG: hypothetical protein MAG795_00507 [Candidatus Woesearchaeota archaeon]|nr:hypothetical protein [Candidatus Woesearchaeota archaeon]